MNNYVVNNTEILFTYLAERFLKLSLSSQPAHISLSGGSTPHLLFEFIATSDYAQLIMRSALDGKSCIFGGAMNAVCLLII